MSKEMDSAVAWLSDLGYSYVDGRLGTYKKHIDEIAEYNISGKLGTLLYRKDYFELANSVFEANEFVKIYDSLHKHESDVFNNKLKSFIKGPVSYVKEDPKTSSNLARNIAFELLIAAEMSRAGYEIEFNDKYDIGFIVNGKRIVIECKRPQYEHQINSNIKGALKQLLKRYNGPNERGLIAISLSRAYNPKFNSVTVNIPEEISIALRYIIDDFIKKFFKKWQNPSDSRSIGTIAHFSGPSTIKSQNLLTMCTNIGISNVQKGPKEDHNLLRILLSDLEKTYASILKRSE